MAIVMGPVLSFRATDHEGLPPPAVPQWQISVLLVSHTADAPPAVAVARGTVSPPVIVLKESGLTARRYDMSVPLDATPRKVRYTVAGTSYDFHVPALGQAPTMAYASCNGFSDEKLMKGISNHDERWDHLLATHKGKSGAHGPFHVLVMGGDQIYADAMWSTVAPLRDWMHGTKRERRSAKFVPATQKAVREFYLAQYVRQWSRKGVAASLARIPTLMMWDDHDIFDGYGSYGELNGCDVHTGIFEVAREFFRALQLQCAPNEQVPGALDTDPGAAFSYARRVGFVEILALDLRSERSDSQIMSDRTWAGVRRFLSAAKSGVKHLVVMLSIPLVYPDFIAVEKRLGSIPGNAADDLPDDLRDHWSSPPHHVERARLIARLLAVSETKSATGGGTRVTVLSGDVHVGAVGVIESTRGEGGNAGVINQLTSSAVMHPPPPALVIWAIEHLMNDTAEPIRGVTTRMLELPGAGRKLLAARNWLSIAPDEREFLWAHWWLEGAEYPYEKPIHPL